MGLYYNSDPEDTKHEIENNVPDSIDKIWNISTKRSITEGFKHNMFMVQLKKGKPLDDIIKIKFILRQRIRWEKLKSTKKNPHMQIL